MSHGPQVSAATFLREIRKLQAQIAELQAKLALYEAKPVKRGQWFAKIEKGISHEDFRDGQG